MGGQKDHSKKGGDGAEEFEVLGVELSTTPERSLEKTFSEATHNKDGANQADHTDKSSDQRISDETRTKAHDTVKEVEASFRAAVRNGLWQDKDEFVNKEMVKSNESLRSATRSLFERKYRDALAEATSADESLSSAFQKKGRRWRIINILALHTFVWLVIWLGILAWLGYAFYTITPPSTLAVPFITPALTLPVSTQFRLLVLTILAGGLGAILRGLYWLGWDVTNRRYWKSSLTDYLMTPFIGVLFGFLAYATIGAGLLAAAQTTASKSKIFYAAASFFVGFNWKAGRELLDRVGKAVLGTGDNKKSQETHA